MSWRSNALLRSGRAAVGGPPPSGSGRTPGVITQRGNFLTLAEKQNAATLGHSVMGDWASMQPTSSTATTGSDWTTLDTTIGQCHTQNVKLILRISAGIESTPIWVYTAATNPVPWIDALTTGLSAPYDRVVKINTAPSFNYSAPNYNTSTGANKQADYPIPLPWDVTVGASPTTAQIITAVNNSALRYHWNRFIDLMLVPWLNAPCPGNASHSRGTHVLAIPATLGSWFGTEVTTSNSNKVKGYTLESTEGARNAVLANLSNINTNAQLVTAYKQIWTIAIQDMVAKLPTNIYVNWMAGVVFGSVNMQFQIRDEVLPALNRRCVIGRTDLRESYIKAAGNTPAFGGGELAATSPIRLLMGAHDQNIPYCIQTAGDAQGPGVASFFDWTDGAGNNRTKTIQQAVDLIQDFLSRCPYPLFFETSLSWDDPIGAAGAGVFNGEQMATVATHGTGAFDGVATRWQGGTVALREYLTSGTSCVQAQIA